MRKTRSTIKYIAILTALSCIGAVSFFAQKSTPATATAQETANTVQTALISPTDYQQYLPLIAPTAVSATENYTAIADGNTIYIYDARATVYREYTHATPINQLAFDSADNLYFLSEFELYKLSADSLTAVPEATKTHVICSNFTIHGNRLYYYAMSKTVIKRYDLTNGTYSDLTLSTPLQDGSPLTFGFEGLYYVSKNSDGYTVQAVNVETGSNTAIATFAQPLQSIAIANHLFCAVTENGTFYAYNYNDLRANKKAELVTPVTETDEKGYLSVCTLGGFAYAIRGNAVKRYSVSNAAFTDFEITSSSSSPHRFNGANDLFLAENRLFIADDGNDRISIYNVEDGQFETPVSTALDAPFIVSYKETLLVSSSQESAIYSLSANRYGETLITLSADELDGNVIGAACVYDRYYLLTDDNYCYTFTQNEGVWSYAEQQKITVGGMKATAFTADVYGSLYVAYDSGEVYRYTEKELTSLSSTGTRVLDNLNGATKIAVDCKENFYALANGILTKYAQNEGGMYEVNATFTPDYGLVKDDNPTLISFAFGVESTSAYFLYAGNYAVQSDEVQIPVVSPIPVGNAVECIFGADNQTFSLVTINEDAILTEFDVTVLQGATEFPYLAFERCYTPFTALKIGEEAEYSILAVARGATGYKTYLVRTDDCTPLAETDYREPYAETGYLTNDISLYKFPYLTELLTVAKMPRGAKVHLLDEIKLLERTYYEIAYTDENGEVKTGYIPTVYINLFDGTDPAVQTVTYGETTDDTDAVGRLIYILLGFGAIGILLDVLLLKKSKETDEN